MTALHPNFEAAIARADMSIQHQSRRIHTERWQGINIKDRPEAEMVEILGWDFRVPLYGETLDRYQREIKPNLPWADNHFEERVCGKPLNPGETWKTWPWAQSADRFRDGKGRFEVSYMERYWAGEWFEDTPKLAVSSTLTGIRGRPYGDLTNIIQLLSREPLTRQAYLPIFFPEDTGGGGRVPCTLGYHWIMRGGFLHVYYPIRSCDYYRHFRDDIYLTIRLTIWLLHQLRIQAPEPWKNVRLGYFSMWIGSLHLFINDYIKLYGAPPK